MKFEPGMICFLIIDGELCKVRPLFNVSSQAPSWHAKIWDVKDNINSNSINSQAVTLSQVSSSFSMDGVLLWTPGPSWRKGNFYKQWTTRRSWNCRWSAEGSDCTSFILLLPFDLLGCHFCPWNLKRLRLIISCNTCLGGPFLFFLRIFWGQKNFVERQKLVDFHLNAKVDVRTKDAFSKNHLFGAWSLLFGPKFDVKKDPRWGTKRSTVVEYLLSTIGSGVSLDELSCYCVILWYRKKLCKLLGFKPLKYRLKSQWHFCCLLKDFSSE